MRDKNVLDKFEDIKILHQYLYMSDEHSVEVVNSIGVPLRIRMDENLHYWCKNLNFPNVPEADWSESMTLGVTLSVIEQLKETPAVEFPKRFKNRWEEIKELTKINVFSNKK